jgi:hypothetical protein
VSWFRALRDLWHRRLRRRACRRGEHLWALRVIELPEPTYYHAVPGWMKMRLDAATSHVRIEKRYCTARCGAPEEWVTADFCDACRLRPGTPTPEGYRRCDLCRAKSREKENLSTPE